MSELFGWIALAATCVAAVVTAANLGARITGYGFAIFFVGAIGWCVVGAETGQHQLLWSNLFLALVDLLGIWRWLYRRARADDAVARGKRGSAARNMFALADLAEKPVRDASGETLAIVEGALADSATGTLMFLVVRTDGAVGQPSAFKQLPWEQCRRVSADGVATDLDAAAFEALPSP